ncbi:MAG: hypothetical protein ACTSPM_02860 [Candidatus Heimdallarchaeota archaeon]
MKRRSDDLDKWIAILSKLSQSEDGIADDKKLGLSFYAIRSSTVGDYHKLNDILEDMVIKGFIEVVEEIKEKNEGEEAKVVRYRITLKGMRTLFDILIPARDALRGLDF